MTLRFVKTSILSSEDGIDFGKEVAVESEETRKARFDAERALNKPLHQQLSEIKDRKLEEYNENTKKMFAPPKALDEDDVNYFQELDNIKARAMDARESREQRELTAFREAQKIDRTEFVAPVQPIKLLPAVVEKKNNVPVTTFVKRKKVVDEDKVASGANASEDLVQRTKKHKSGMAHEQSSSAAPSVQTMTTVETNSTSGDASQSVVKQSLSLLTDYGSDSD